MKIERTPPIPPPPLFTMSFSSHEGMALVMALRDAHAKYEDAADRAKWLAWAEELTTQLKAADRP